MIIIAFNPIAFSLGSLQIHWYGLMYLFGFLSAWFLATWRNKHYNLLWTEEQISDVIFYIAVGVIIGGRCGYMIFYNHQELLHHPLSLLKIWEGGMSFHGGLLGVIVAILFFTRKVHKTFLEISDFIVPLVPLGLAYGRIGNFINGELWGRVTDVSWAMIFPSVDYLPRHPSQLYEASLEGPILLIIVWWYANKPRPIGHISAVFLIGYAIFRCIAEYFREPDLQLGYLIGNWLTMGISLSIPMLLLGVYLLILKK